MRSKYERKYSAIWVSIIILIVILFGINYKATQTNFSFSIFPCLVE